MKLDDFNRELVATTTTEGRLTLLRRYVLHGTPCVYNGRETDYFDFKDSISRKFGIGFNAVLIVGSAKLGFSYIKSTSFSYESDIDVALVSADLFETYLKDICDYQYEHDRIFRELSQDELRKYNRFLQYLVKGWMRPDLLPSRLQVGRLRTEWFDYFASISYGRSTIGNYKVAAGLYKSYDYLERYHMNGLQSTFEKLKTT